MQPQHQQRPLNYSPLDLELDHGCLRSLCVDLPLTSRRSFTHSALHQYPPSGYSTVVHVVDFMSPCSARQSESAPSSSNSPTSILVPLSSEADKRLSSLIEVYIHFSALLFYFRLTLFPRNWLSLPQVLLAYTPVTVHPAPRRWIPMSS